MNQRDAKGNGREATESGHHDHDHSHAHAHTYDHGHVHADASGEHGHSHGLVDRSIIRSRAGIKAVSLSLGVLMATALAQAAIFVLSDSVALLADLIHDVGDGYRCASGIAFFLRSFRGEKIAGLVVVAVIFVSAMVALYEAVDRFIHPKELTHLSALAGAGAIGFLGNEIAAQIRLRSGRRLASPALVADGKHARVDGFVSPE